VTLITDQAPAVIAAYINRQFAASLSLEAPCAVFFQGFRPPDTVTRPAVS
jgi:hypothetical protein